MFVKLVGMSDRTPLRVSFIIPALNESENITRAVTTALAAGAAEVIVADGGSDDDTVKLAVDAGAKVVTATRGRAMQQNAGAKAATGDVLLFQHADNWCGQDTVQQIQAALDDEAIHGGAFRQRIEASGWMFRLLEFGNSLRVKIRRMPFGDQAIFMRREVFEQLGGFPEVPLMEDVLLMRAFRKIAKPVLLDGPHHVSPRRWQRYGVIRQTLRNWRIQLAHRLGASPDDLARSYVRHDA